MKYATLTILLLLLLSGCRKESPQNTELGKDNLPYAKARKLRDAGKSDSAFYYYNLAKNEYLTHRDSVGTAQSLINMAIIQTNKNDCFGGIETSVEAEKYLKNTRDSLTRINLARNYNNMAIASSFLSNYDDAMRFYKKGIALTDNPEYKKIYYNNIGEQLTRLKDYRTALRYLNRAVETEDQAAYARALNNRAYTEFLLNGKNPLPDYYRALTIREAQQDPVGMNSSYATLADYYKTVNRDSSLAYAYRMKATAEEIKSPDDQLQALQKIILLDQEHYRTHFESFQKVYDSVTPARARARNQFALVKSNIRKTALRNAELEALTLRNENRLLVRNILMAISVAAVIFVVIFFTLRRRKMLRDRLMEVQNTELKYSKRVHDVVANGIYQVMTKLENHLEISRSETLDDLEDIYHQSRNISYTQEETQEDSTAFKEKIRKLAGYFNSRDVATILVGNDAETWQNISSGHKAEVYQVLRELLINMKKHSHASRVTLRFETSAENLTVHYADNGIGIGTDPVFKNGTRNMVNRMEKINGRITFEKNPEKGLQVSITIPLH